ncbi:hypothetical protein HR086_21400 [Myxococcus sp. CA039A]|nr:hypothetical protein [Myxococcus sp. CA039A]
MRFLGCAVLLLFFSACATSAPGPGARVPPSRRVANLQRAANLPWTDGGKCAVHQASQPWPVLAERCFQALDHDRVRFNDPTGRCSVASVGMAVMGTGLCVLAAPEIIAGAVLVVGVLVVGVAIKEALDAYALSGSRPAEEEVTLLAKPASRESSSNRKPQPEPAGQDWFSPTPPDSPEKERHPRCEPVPVPHLGGDAAHDRCADQFPPNRFPGKDVLVKGKRFDALQVGVRVLWEIKTDQFDTYSDFLQGQVVRQQVATMREERSIATECGYGFVVGVSTEAHKEALVEEEATLNIVVTGCKR